ncbi:HAMP domain-containing protein [Bacillus sp. BGMRC 2118]|nr:HAMP domain-containing protein [Bacillus sp. BGMRC 2118]
MKALLRRYNTLRNQILVIYVLAMIIVLMIVGAVTYYNVLEIIKDKAESQMQQTALEATGRMESLYQQINSISTQVATEPIVQDMLDKKLNGYQPGFSERQSLSDKINKLQIYSNGINSIELYSKDFNRVVPLDDIGLKSRIKEEWIKEAEEKKGGLVWIGRDLTYPDYFLAIKKVSLIDQSFTTGGYLLIQINPNLFQFMGNDGNRNQSQDYMILLDQNNQQIVSNFPGRVHGLEQSDRARVTLNESEFMYVKRHSALTGWTFVKLTPVRTLMEGVSILRTITILSGIFGFLLFLILSFFLSTILTRPILKLTKVMKKRSQGELSLNPEISSTIEINELNDTYNQMAEEINNLIHVVYEKELIRSRTELKALQSQINPHFLFNTLNAIYWTLEEKGDEELANLIIAMSELFRYTIDHNTDEWVTLSQELSHIEQYMQIMKFRLDRIYWSIHIPKEYEGIKIPKLLIQPIVENAIIHGISKKSGEGCVTISIEKSENSNRLICIVEDNGVGMENKTLDNILALMNSDHIPNTNGNGIAIVNVNKRLKLYYPNTNQTGIHIESELHKGTICTFEIPLVGEDDTCASQF